MIITKDDLVINRQSCPVCNSESRTILFSAKHNSPGFLDFIKFEEFYSKALYDGYSNGPLNELLFEIAECNNCRNIYLTEVLNDKGMELLYNEWLDKDLLKVYYSNQVYSIYEETMLRVIKKHFRKKDKINILDFGAGYGNFCSIATKLGLNTYAFDLSTDKNEHLDNMGVTIINNFDKYKGYFDFIYINQVFEHVSDPGGILKSLRQCLTDKGLLFMSVPNCKNVKKIVKEEGLSHKLFKLISPHQHINGFNNSSLKIFGAKAGLKALSMFDFLRMFKTSFNTGELKFLIKKVIKNSKFGTGLFFAPVAGQPK
jgi:2-polyprenyl-3-methyl-5-hydroxy-6-metoxy-1,4-benzoquinol methylase